MWSLYNLECLNPSNSVCFVGNRYFAIDFILAAVSFLEYRLKVILAPVLLA